MSITTHNYNVVVCESSLGVFHFFFIYAVVAFVNHGCGTNLPAFKKDLVFKPKKASPRIRPLDWRRLGQPSDPGFRAVWDDFALGPHDFWVFTTPHSPADGMSGKADWTIRCSIINMFYLVYKYGRADGKSPRFVLLTAFAFLHPCCFQLLLAALCHACSLSFAWFSSNT
jgi:hypothetical protein